jgi:hypothetical protein
MIGVSFRLEAGLLIDPFFLLGLKWRTIRVPSLSGGRSVGGLMLLKASVMMGCRDAMLFAWGEDLSGRVPQADAMMSRQRGMMERSIVSGPEILGFRRR